MENHLYEVADRFDLTGKIESIVPHGEGHIHESYIVRTVKETDPDYIFQKKNKYVFRNVPAMMDNISKVTDHLKKKIIAKGGDPLRETITLVNTNDGKLFYRDESDEFWAMCLLIRDGITYQKVESAQLAVSGGKSIGRFQSMLSDFDLPLVDILPGYHNMKFRFDQWDQSLSEDPAARKKDLAEEIAWIENRRKNMLDFWDLIEKEHLPRRVAHNDTKISNILFDKNQEAFCVIDLDTVLRSTVLNDFGDSIRTYTNTGQEDDPELDNVSLDLNIYNAYCRGYLAEARTFLSETEIENLAFSALYITFEQVLRFLMDYINGDKYYRIHYPEHNLVRTRAQYKLLQSMEKQYDLMRSTIQELR